MEHVSSKKLIDKLDEFLGFPRFDPHGDPIPDSHGKIENTKQIPLASLPINRSVTVIHVSDQSGEILELLDEKNISIGSRVVVKKKFDFDNSLEIKVGKKPSFNISEKLAKNIYVKHE